MFQLYHLIVHLSILWLSCNDIILYFYTVARINQLPILLLGLSMLGLTFIWNLNSICMFLLFPTLNLFVTVKCSLLMGNSMTLCSLCWSLGVLQPRQNQTRMHFYFYHIPMLHPKYSTLPIHKHSSCWLKNDAMMLPTFNCHCFE